VYYVNAFHNFQKENESKSVDRFIENENT